MNIFCQRGSTNHIHMFKPKTDRQSKLTANTKSTYYHLLKLMWKVNSCLFTHKGAE